MLIALSAQISRFDCISCKERVKNFDVACKLLDKIIQMRHDFVINNFVSCFVPLFGLIKNTRQYFRSIQTLLFLILLSCSLFSTLPYPLYSPNSDLSLDYKSTSPTITPLGLDPGSSLTHGHVLSSTSNIRSIRGITDWYHNAIILSDSNFLCCLLYTIFSELLVYSFDSAFLISPCTYLVRACTLLMSKYIVGKKLSEDILHRSSSAFEGGPLPF